MNSTLAAKLAALKASQNTSIVSEDTSPTPVTALLLLFIKTPSSAYKEHTIFFTKLYNWLKPFSFPPVREQSAQRHFLTTTNLMRYMANMLSIPVGQLQDILKYEVYPMLDQGGCSYEY